MHKAIGLMVVVGAVSISSGCDVEDKDQGGATMPTDESESDTDGETDGETDGDDPGPMSTTPAPEPEPEPEPEPACHADESRSCFIDGVECGIQYCVEGEWDECAATENCGGGETSTPLVLSFDGAAPQLVASPAASFDNDLADRCFVTDWPMATTPWLALDRDGDGGISDGRELFGSGTRMGTGDRAEHGFAALAELDGDGDGKITPADPRFAELLVWADEDGDKRGTGGELRSLADLHVISIELAFDVEKTCDDRGNCGLERASFTYAGRGGAIATGTVIDLHLACQ